MDGELVRLSHLIEGLPASADQPVFRAPAPGARGTIRADRVLAAARDMGVKDIEAGSLTTVTIHRPGRTIARTDLQTGCWPCPHGAWRQGRSRGCPR